MKKYINFSIIIGAVLTVLGFILPAIRLFSLEGYTYLLVLMSESIWLTCALFGLSFLIMGIVNRIFIHPKTETSTVRTEVYSISAGVTLGISVYYLLMWLIITQSALQSINHKEYVMSIAITLICLVCFFLLVGFYFKERKEKELKKGLGFGIFNIIIYILPAFFLADNIYKILISILF